MMVKLYNKQTNEFLGRVSKDQWGILVQNLEEKSPADRSFYIRKETLDSFQQSGADPRVVDLLRVAMKPVDFIEIRWEEEK